MKKAFFLIAVILCCTGLFGQDASPSSEAAAIPPDAVLPVIVFTQAWPEATPPYYSITVDSAGHVTYRSSAKPENSDDAYDLKFQFSDETRGNLFNYAKQADYFRGNYDYKRSRIAYTGTKTLRFHGDGKDHSTTYNWSDNLAIQSITKIFQNVSETIELGRIVADKYRFDKLGVDAEMKKLEEATKEDRTAELQAIQPILSKIAKDPSMMNITRRRAESLLAKISKTAKTGGRQ